MILLQKSVYFLIITLCRSASVTASASVHRIVEQEVDTDSGSIDEYERHEVQEVNGSSVCKICLVIQKHALISGGHCCAKFLQTGSLTVIASRQGERLHVSSHSAYGRFSNLSHNSGNKRAKLYANRFSEKSLSKKGDLLLLGR